MTMKNIIAVIREDALDGGIDILRDKGVPGVTVVDARGYGEYANSYSRNPMETYQQIEVMVDAAQAEAVAQIIMNAARSGTEGDGIVAITPVDKFYRIRDRQAF